MSDSQEWLDTETAAILSGTPPRKLAPARAAGFSLVMLAEGADPLRTAEALRRIPRVAEEELAACERRECPFVVVSGLTEADALLGQFELICADCISVFIQDEVVRGADSRYMADLYSRLLESPEFEQVRVVVRFLPPGEAARQYLAQFVSKNQGEEVFGGVMSRKKARIMQHWGIKIGATIYIEA